MAGWKGRHVVAARLMKLARRLDGARYPVPLSELAAWLGVCQRTVRRDITALDEAGWDMPAYAFLATDSNDRDAVCHSIAAGLSQ